MDRNYYINIAKQNKRMIFGVDLILHEKENHNETLQNGELLGKAVIETTRRFGMEMALPFMDLDIEKQDLLNILGKDLSEVDSFHFDNTNLNEEILTSIKNAGLDNPVSRLSATCKAITFVKENSDFLPVGMCIGPFSFITKLLSDPISPVFMASMGISGGEDDSVKLLELAIKVATELIIRSVKFQIAAGAKAICVCEPAANMVYISPDTLSESDEDVFDRFVIEYNKKIKEVMDNAGVDLILHNCGELTDLMLKKLCTLNPVILSLGSSRKLWEDTQIVAKDIVLLGNLPSKKFFMDNEITKEKVKDLTLDLEAKMKETGHPFILGSECDILSVKGHETTIREKVDIMLNCS